MERTENSLRDFWDNIKLTNNQVIGVPEEEEKGVENVFCEIMAKNFSKFKRETEIGRAHV